MWDWSRRGLLLAGAVLVALTVGGCAPVIEDGQFRCDPALPGSCPPGWVCQIRGDLSFPRCFEHAGGYCGDGELNVGEQCDGTAFAHDTCEGYGLPPGYMICRGDCVVTCTRCGNGVVELVTDTEREECDDGNTESNDGCSADCRYEVCGDGIVQDWEVCDDGNLQSGDGCSPSCLSTEACGNGIVDAHMGEQCDDGNLRSRDGCSSTCALEIPLWERRESPLARGRVDHAMAYDAANQRMVLFGGNDGTARLGDTWLYDGSRWLHLDVVDGPPARSNHTLTYDATNQRVVLFGGEDDTQLFADTWVLEGDQWTQLAPATAPPARGRHGAAFHAPAGRLVVFGGNDGSGWLDDTWELDVATDTWAQASPELVPTARGDHGMIYDSVRQRVVLVGGYDGSSTSEDTWLYNGLTWVELPDAMIQPLHNFALAFDASRGKPVMFGGFNEMMGFSYLHLYQLEGNEWQPVLVALGGEPWGRSRHAMAFDSHRGRLVFYGGLAVDYLTDTWELEGETFIETSPPTQPPARMQAAMTYDSARGRVVLFGGTNASFTAGYPDTWEYDGVQWLQVPTDSSPPPLSGHSMTYDEHRGVVVVYGGLEISNQLGVVGHEEIWEYDGTDWVNTTPPESPPWRWNAAMTYDEVRQRVLLFGGIQQDLYGGMEWMPCNDLWEYDGERWQELSAADPPPGRGSAAMVYDPDRFRTLVFGGGSVGQSEHDDLWAFDGLGWQELSSSPSPSWRGSMASVYHRARHSLILFGGAGSGILWDTWEHDGSRWHRLSPPVSPPPRSDMVSTYDRRRQALVMFGGGPDVNDETYELVWRSTTPDEICQLDVDADGDGLVGCDDPDCNGWPRCQPTELCRNGVDDDGDGLVDCADPSCGGAPCGADLVCFAGECRCPGGDVETSCADLLDNDCDGLVDADDPDCSRCADAAVLRCTDESVDGSTLSGSNGLSAYGCVEWLELGPERVYRLETTGDATSPVTVTLTLTPTIPGGDPDLFVVTGAAQGGCDPVNGCVAASSLPGLVDQVSFVDDGSKPLYVVVDSFAAQPVEYRLQIECAP